LGRREGDNAASLFQDRAAFVAERTFAWENPSKAKFAGVFIRILARCGYRGPPKTNEKTQLG
jgi:hypothetical protein